MEEHDLEESAAKVRRWLVARLVASGRLARRTARNLVAFARGTLVRRTLVATWHFSRASLIAVLLVALGSGIAPLALERVEPGWVAVRQANWGAERGIANEDTDPGLHLGFSGLTSWHDLDMRTQLLSFTWKSEGGDTPPLEFLTAEGNAARIAAVLAYRVRPGEAHAIVAAGQRSTYRRSVVAAATEALTAEAARMRTDELIDPFGRAELSQRVFAALQPALRGIHIELQNLEIGAVAFAGTFEKRLQDRQLERQKSLTGEALHLFARHRSEVAEIEQRVAAESQRAIERSERRLAEQRIEFERQIEEVKRESRTYVESQAVLAAEEYQQMLAQGDAALADVDVLREELVLDTLESEGGRIWIARKAASKLRFGRVVLDSSDERTPAPFNLAQLAAFLAGDD